MTRNVTLLFTFALLLAAGAVWWWNGGDATPRLEPSGSIAAADGAARSSGGAGESRDGAGRDSRDASNAAAIEAARAADAVDPLAPPEPQEIDAIESEGRALFWGVVVAPDSKPCAGATIWHDGRIAATSDERGHYRIDVVQRTWDVTNDSNDGFAHWLHARKEGVGVVQVSCAPTSRRIDLALKEGYAISGRVARRGGGAAAGARVEFRVAMQSPSSGEVRPLMPLETTCDVEGRFAFATLLGTRFALRASADGWASCGWFEFDADPARGRHGIDFELEPLLTATGWFAPWPPPGFERADAAKARVVATDAQAAAATTPPESASAPIGEDGTFRVPFVATPALELRIDVAGGVAWRRAFDLPREPRDLDLGRIELDAPGRFSGELSLPPELLALGFEFVLGFEAAGGRRELRVPVAADGRFLSPPLPAAPVFWCIALGEASSREWLVAGSDERPHPFGSWKAGETNDLGRLVPRGALVAGRIVGGASVAATLVEFCFGEGDDVTGLHALADEQGRYLVALPEEAMRWDIFEELARLGGARLTATRHAMRASIALPRVPAPGLAQRVDVTLGDGARVSGRVVDEAGAPRRRVQLQLLLNEGTRDVLLKQHQTWTDGDGRFACSGLAPGNYIAFEIDFERATMTWLGAVTAPAAADVTLTRRTGDPADGE